MAREKALRLTRYYGFRVVETTDGPEGHLLLDGGCAHCLPEADRQRLSGIVGMTYQGRRIEVSHRTCARHLREHYTHQHHSTEKAA
ncbi:MAG TPA: hypothetical protein VD948_08710 [Rhodothermales bacterium]|nr:hypothetical protein [Rhodothermales bacterium]